jgi:hypothetical protein
MDAVEQTILQNQNILPAQFFNHSPDAARMEPLRRLALAVLMDAVRVFQNQFGARTLNGRRQFNEAREWLLGAPGQGPFSFENVCYITNIDAVHLRKSLRGWQTMKRAGQPCRSLARRSPVTRQGALRVPRSKRRSAESI